MNTTNDLRHTISIDTPRTKCTIKIRLNDECKNGHEDFAITADFKRIDGERCDMGGCCHEDILSVRPDLAPFVALHLCDWKGAPMHPKANGFYHLQRFGMAKFTEYFRCTPLEWVMLKNAEDENHFWYLLTVSDIPTRWEKEAKAVTALLEKMTGEKFESKATRQHFEPMSGEEITAFAIKQASGYYSPEALQERRQAAKEDKLNKYLALIEEHYTSEEWKERKTRDVKLFVARLLGSTCDNLIFYTHTDTLCLNWQDHISPKFTPEQIATVRAHIGELSFPVTVTEKN